MKAIAAVNSAGYIGKGGDLLYSLKEDMAYFRAATMGKTLVMGRKTLLSLPEGKGLKGRTNLVLSRSMDEVEAAARGVLAVRDVKGLLDRLEKLGVAEEDVYVIGGGEIYSLLLPYCDELFITRIFREDEGEVKFPEIPSDFRLIPGEKKTDGEIAYRFDRYVRIR